MKKELKSKLDKVFSQYIRRKYTVAGYGRCYTCGAVKPYEDLDAGHYITRNNLNTRWDERNVKVQCRQCNRFLSGNSDEFAIALKKEYGENILDELNKDKWVPQKIDDLTAIAMIKELEDKLNDL